MLFPWVYILNGENRPEDSYGGPVPVAPEQSSDEVTRNFAASELRYVIGEKRNAGMM